MPMTGELPCLTVKVAAVSVRGSIGLLKVAEIFVLVAMFTPSAGGVVVATIGATVSAVVPVVKLQEWSWP